MKGATEDNFRKAVAHVVETYNGRIAKGQIKSSSVEPSEFLYMYGLPIVQGFDGNMTTYTLPEGAAEWLCLKAKTDKGAFDLACRIVASRLFRNETLSLPLRHFAGQRVVGLANAPKGSRDAKTVSVNLLLLVTTMRIAKQFELSLTRSDASEPFSACDAVSDGLLLLGHSRSWRAIKELIVNGTSQKLRTLEAEIRQYVYKIIEEQPGIAEQWAADSASVTRDGED